MKSYLQKAILVLPLVAFLFFSFKTGKQEHNRLNGDNYNAKALFSAIYFSNHSQMTENIINANSFYKTNFKPEIHAFLDKIEQDRPGFFEEFKMKITSGDKLNIKKELVETSKFLGVYSKAPQNSDTTYQYVVLPSYVVTYVDNTMEYVVLPSPPVLWMERASLNNGNRGSLELERISSEIASLF